MSAPAPAPKPAAKPTPKRARDEDDAPSSAPPANPAGPRPAGFAPGDLLLGAPGRAYNVDPVYYPRAVAAFAGMGTALNAVNRQLNRAIVQTRPAEQVPGQPRLHAQQADELRALVRTRLEALRVYKDQPVVRHNILWKEPDEDMPEVPRFAFRQPGEPGAAQYNAYLKQVLDQEWRALATREGQADRDALWRTELTALWDDERLAAEISNQVDLQGLLPGQPLPELFAPDPPFPEGPPPGINASPIVCLLEIEQLPRHARAGYSFIIDVIYRVYDEPLATLLALQCVEDSAYSLRKLMTFALFTPNELKKTESWFESETGAQDAAIDAARAELLQSMTAAESAFFAEHPEGDPDRAARIYNLTEVFEDTPGFNEWLDSVVDS